jgi:ATP-dependent helicase/nuclease subunit A
VALTRAEDRLLVCGWETRSKQPKDECWYEAVRRGMARLGAEARPLEGVGEAWPGERLVHASGQTAGVTVAAAHEPAAVAPLPDWAGGPPDWVATKLRAEPLRPVPLAPSRPEDSPYGPVPAASSPGGGRAAAERGTLIHTLLQHVPALPEAARDAALAAYVRQAGAAPEIAAEVAGILAHEQLRPLFAPGSRAEQPLAGYVGGAVVSGVVDRLAVLPDAVLVADYKTGRDAPATPEATPVLYLRQMAAYRAVLRGLFPGREVRCFLVWTRSAAVSLLPHALLDAHAPGALDGGTAPAHVAASITGEGP